MTPARGPSTSLPDIHNDIRVPFLGSTALSTFIGGIETGLIIALFMRYWAHSHSELLYVKIMVPFVTLVALFQTGCSFSVMWKRSVIDFGDWQAIAIPSWPSKVQSFLTALMATPIQLYLVWRCWRLLGRRWYVAVPLVLLVIGSVITNILIWVTVLRTDFTSSGLHGPAMEYYVSFVLSVAFPAALDIALTSILLTFLIRSRTGIHTRRFQRIITRLIMVTWESAIPPCACALATFFCTIRSAPYVSFWDIMLQSILGKLYLISLFLILDSRVELAHNDDPTHFPTLTGPAESAWSYSPSRARETPQQYHLSMATAPRHAAGSELDIESRAGASSAAPTDESPDRLAPTEKKI
ncbi:hypothetical protein BC834DRAFT_402974 [Gloeopeniophorella convolvens]|nr:hypothetical protein BC834DRAFT_402974 [Gloeopeniophorella convolvens]